MPLVQSSTTAVKPLSPEQVVTALAQVSFPRVHRLASFWLKHDPEQNSLTQLYCHQQGHSILALPAHYGVRSKVHEYGGLPYGLSDHKIVWVDEQSQQLYCADLLDQPVTQDLAQDASIRSPVDLDSLRLLTQNPDSRYGEPIIHPNQSWVVAIEERHPNVKHQPIINQLVAIELATGQQQVIACGADFYTSPCFNAEGTELAWIEWRHPHQPWTDTQLCKAHWQSEARLERQLVFPTPSLSAHAASVQQPSFNAQGELLFISDHQGYWNLYLYRLDGRLETLYSVEADCASAPWQFGNRHYQLLEQQADRLQLLISVTRGGQWQLERVTLTRDEQGDLHQRVSKLDCSTYSFSFFAQISSLKHLDQPISTVLVLVASAQYALSVITFELDHHAADVHQVRFLDQGAYLADAVQPEAISLNLKAHQVQGLFYPNPNCSQAPLMINVHGGPTSAAFCGLQANIQFWCQQGFSVLDLNHRGSTGFGRHYRQALKGQWGELDLEDARLMAHWLTKNGRTLPDKVVIRGQSAGGYSALRAATLGYFQAAVSLYGISDLQRLAASTHKFESYYLHWLIGDPKEESMLYQLRSPLYTLNQQASLPDLLLFQGAQDRVVPLEQVTQFTQHYRALGHRCETVVYDNEGHGFRAFHNRLHQLNTELAFYLGKGILHHGSR